MNPIKLYRKTSNTLKRYRDRWKAVIEFHETVKELSRIRKEDALKANNKNCRNVGNYPFIN